MIILRINNRTVNTGSVRRDVSGGIRFACRVSEYGIVTTITSVEGLQNRRRSRTDQVNR